MKQTAVSTMAQDEASCVDFGVPEEVIVSGVAEDVLVLEQMPLQVMRYAHPCN